MKIWKVTSVNGDVDVKATDLTITQSGDLIFHISGEVTFAAARGHWTNVVLLDGGRHGYR